MVGTHAATAAEHEAVREWVGDEDQAPSPSPDGTTRFSRYLDAFLNPRNIQWLLVAGVLILLASSLMLVSANWRDYAPVWKYLILVGYTAGTWLAGRWSYSRLGLRRTGTVILSLAVLLLPVSFLALNLVGMTGPPWVALLLINAIVAGAAARDVFRHFLRGDQPTFLACYLLLCAAGAFMSLSMSLIGAALVALGLWMVFAIGAVKVNRHVFWLAEEHRWPRIFGFFPILLLGTQFLVLYALGPARHLPIQWIGLGCALVAAVVLTTADAVARVFQQRTGDLVRPLPWAIVGPLVVGLTMCAAAVCLAGTGLVPPAEPYAVVPTAAVVCALLTLVARRTGKPAFVWAALIAVTIAYNFSPVFFANLAQTAVSHGAAAVHESRLPYPFYGLTYLPLLAGVLGLGAIARRREWTLIVGPTRGFALGLAVALLALGLGHPKAVFPVALAMTAVLAAHVVLFRDRRIVPIAVVAWLITAAGLCSFVRKVAGIALPFPDAEIAALALSAGTLFVPGIFIDRLVARLPKTAPDWLDHTNQLVSLCLTVVLDAAWVGLLLPAPLTPPGLVAGAVLAVLLITHAVRWLDPTLSAFAVAAVHLILIRSAAPLADLAPATLVSIAGLTAVIQWVSAGALRRYRPDWRVTRALATPARWVAGVELTALLTAVVLPGVWARAAGVHWLLPTIPQPWPLVAGVIIAWGWDAARRAQSRPLATIACLASFGFVAATAANITGGNTHLLAVLAGTSIVALVIAEYLSRRTDWRVLVEAATAVSLAILTAIALASLALYHRPFQIGGLLAAIGLCLAGRLRRLPSIVRTHALALANWQAIAMVLAVLLPPTVKSLHAVSLSHFAHASLPLAVLAALSLVAWQRFGPRLHADVGLCHRILLRLAITACMLASLNRATHGVTEIALAAATFVTLIAAELWAACRSRSPVRVWIAEALMLASAGYFVAAGVIRFGSGLSLYVPLVAALAFRAAHHLATRRPTTAVLARPFAQTALVLPMATVVLGVARGFTLPHAHWLGMSSLALFLSAGFYFWRGLERRQPGWHVLAAAIVNASLALLWHDLRFGDPQFYMVPLGASVLLLVQVLKRELPDELHDPLRYLGALLVLVSPTFHIVGGSWVHLLTLMLLSLAVMLAAMARRVRALLYAGTAFLVADLLAMVVRGSIDHLNLLWLAGLAVGAGVVALGAIAERNREQLLQRVRMLSAALAVWD